MVRIALMAFLSILLLVVPLGARIGIGVVQGAEEASAGDTKASGGCSGKAFFGKYGEEQADDATVEGDYAIDPTLIPEDVSTEDEGVGTQQDASGQGTADQGGQGTDGVPQLGEGECDFDASGVLWCKENGALISGCTALPDGNVECP